jgi:hypothetical protein
VILRSEAGFRLGRFLAKRGLVLPRVEEAIDLVAIEYQAGALTHRAQEGAPTLVEGTAFDADIGDGLGVGHSALHRIESMLTSGLCGRA